MLKTGDYNLLNVSRISRGKFFLTDGKEEIPLPHVPNDLELTMGEELEVFVYTDADGKPVATITTPYAVVGEFACMKVIETNTSGAYLDWGIEKDLFVHTSQQARPMKKGKTYAIFVEQDPRTGKIQGTSFLDEHFSHDTAWLKKGESVSLVIYAITEIGIMAIVNNQYSGMIYISECFEKLKVGDMRTGYIKKIREDGQIDLTLQPRIDKAILGAQKKILAQLEEAGGFLPFHDKSDPEEIKLTFSMSKKNFKKAIGGLYKEKQITLTDKGIRIIHPPK